MVLWVLVPTNSFSSSDQAAIAPYTRAVTLTLSDSADLVETPRAITAHKGSGTHCLVKVTMMGDTGPVTLTIPIGVVYPIRVSRVWSTGTDSTTTVALY